MLVLPKRKGFGVEVVSEKLHAVMGIDPGGTTGVAAAYVPAMGTLKASLRAATRKKAIEVTGDWLEQARQLADLMNRFQYTANVENGIELRNVHYAIEDFVLRMPAATTNLTSVWVAAAATALFAPTLSGVTWQTPAQAKGFATDSRLKLWHLYTRGESAHERDAWRHVALCANQHVD